MAAANADATATLARAGDPEKAQNAVDTTIGDLIMRVLKERQASAAIYESAIIYITETAGLN